MRQTSFALFDFHQDERVQPKPRAAPKTSAEERTARSGTFTDNRRLPIHGWFGYSAGFSAEWAETVIRGYQSTTPITVLDPFAGSGTTLIAAEKVGAKAIGFESHPFVARIANAKLMWSLVDPHRLRDAALEVITNVAGDVTWQGAQPSPLLLKCYTDDALNKLLRVQEEFLRLRHVDQAVRALLWLAITTILRPCSNVGTAQWQYLLPNKKKSNALDPLIALEAKVSRMIRDIDSARALGFRTDAQLLMQDARQHAPLEDASVDLVLTSPPYPNNYDYADATRLEMTFWGEIESWGDLQDAVRKHIIRSCSQHSAAERLQLNDLLGHECVVPIIEELTPVCRSLEEVRLTKGGKKTYHTMIAAYFVDLSNVFRALRPLCKAGSRLCFVIGDSAPYGVHVPVERWLGVLALDAGFRTHSFEKLRDRNLKWKNRKHRVPLQEGRLWITG
jgi:hypothetical protein